LLTLSLLTLSLTLSLLTLSLLTLSLLTLSLLTLSLLTLSLLTLSLLSLSGLSRLRDLLSGLRVPVARAGCVVVQRVELLPRSGERVGLTAGFARERLARPLDRVVGPGRIAACGGLCGLAQRARSLGRV
jgi:hypothetical protein